MTTPSNPVEAYRIKCKARTKLEGHWGRLMNVHRGFAEEGMARSPLADRHGRDRTGRRILGYSDPESPSKTMS